MSSRIPVIYIAGSSHSGSTLLDLLLGSHSAVESVGEAKKIPEILERLDKGEKFLCTCQQELKSCPLWSDLLAGDVGDVERDALATARLYKKVLGKRKKTVILDSSKTLGRTLLFARSNLFEPLFIHLVRDSRAVVFSSRRKKYAGGRSDYGLIKTARSWQKLNSRIPQRLKSHNAIRRLLVRYEELTGDLRGTLEKILCAAGLDWEPSMLNFREHVHHNIEGNRMRMGSSSEIKRDEEYLDSLGRAEWALATLLTWRGLRRFGYPLKRSPVEADDGSEIPSLR